MHVSLDLCRLFYKLERKLLGSKEKTPNSQEAINKIRDIEDLLDKRSQYLENKIGNELEIARKNGTKNKRVLFPLNTFKSILFI